MKNKLTFSILPATFALVALLAGPLSLNLALADHGDGGGSSSGRGGAAVQTAQASRTSQSNRGSGGSRSSGRNKIVTVASVPTNVSSGTATGSTNPTSTSRRGGGDDGNENNNNNNDNNQANIRAMIAALRALVLQLEARLALIEQQLGGGADTTAPMISSTTAVNVTTSTADVMWATNEPASSKVFVSTSTPVDPATAMTVSDATLSLSHSLHLSGLSASTTYFYVVQSADGSGNTATSSQFSFVTASAGGPVVDVTPPVISSTTATDITTSSAEIGWATNEPASSKVFVSTSTPVDPATAMTVSDATLSLSHSLHLSGLSASTTYFYVVESDDAAANMATSSEQSFVTASAPVEAPGDADDATPLAISSTTTANLTASAVDVTWSTNFLSTSKVFVSTSTPVDPATAMTVSDATLSLSHSLHLSGLSASTTYFYVLVSKDVDGDNIATSPELSFTTGAAVGPTDTTPPIVFEVDATDITTSSAEIGWATNEPASSKVFVSTSTPVDPATAMTVSDATLSLSHSLHLSGLSASTTYFYVVQSADGSGNTATSSQFSFVTASAGGPVVDVTPPVISSTTATDITTSSAEIGWATNEPASSKVFVSTSTPVDPATAMTVSDATLSLSHSLHLSGLSASTTYFYVVESDDAAANMATSSEQSFVTASAPVEAPGDADDATPLAISSTTTANLTASAVDVTWSTNFLSTSKVFVSTSTPVDPATAMTVSDATLSLSHSLHLSGLSASTTYFYVLVSKDVDGDNIATSPEQSFTTSVAPVVDVTPPVISSTTATDITTSSAEIGWATNEPASSKVFVSTSTPVDPATAMTVSDATLSLSHSLHLSGLSASTTYFYVVESDDAAANMATSSEQSFVTAGE